MRSMQVLGVVGSVMVLAACERGEALRALQKQPPALGMERVGAPLVPLPGSGAGSTIALARRGDKRLALVADADAKVVRILDTKAEKELPVTELGGSPSQLVVAGDGRVFVALRDRAEVDILEPGASDDAALRVTGRVSTAEEPTALSLTPDGRTLLVSCGWGHALDAFATRTMEHRFRVNMAREPRAVVTSEDGALAYVSHATSSLVSVVDLEGPEHDVDVVRLGADTKVNAVLPESEGGESFAEQQPVQWRQGFALARTEIGILAPGVTVQTGDLAQRPETYGGGGGDSMPAENFALNLVHPHAPGGRGDADAPAKITLTLPNSCLLPRAAAYDAEGQWLMVACEGENTVWRVDARLEPNNSHNASWKVDGEPTGLAVDAATRSLFVWSQAAHTVTSIAVDAWHPNPKEMVETTRVVTLGPEVDVDDKVAQGRALFHQTGDHRISGDGRACASCHPDGRDDGLVWATPDGPRQTPTLAGRLSGTAPYGWNGARSTVKKHVASTLKRLGGTGLDDPSLEALVAYCITMDAPPRAAEAKQEEPEPATLAAEGRDLFASSSTGCASCHSTDGTFTDGSAHDVKSKAKGDPHRRFDTPSLRFVSGTAPYFHDGRYATLRELLVASDGKMGHTAKLSPHDLDALEAYLGTL